MHPLRSRVALACALVTLGGAMASAQTDTPLSPMQVAAGCAPSLSSAGEPERALHVLGAQDPSPRGLLGPRDLLILSGGTRAGVQLGQEFFVRREIRFGISGRRTAKQPLQGVTTAGWIRVVAVNDSTAVALVLQACGPIFADDYLDAFVAPSVPANAGADDASGEPDFSALGRIIVGREDRTAAGAGDFMLIDRGSDQGVVAGSRFAVYRDLRAPGLPLSSIGEAVVISTGPDRSLMRITRARDAVMKGDYVALRR
jgi:hypothetical protein